MTDFILSNLPGSFDTIGVVPIFVNAGAALLPAIIAGVSSVLGIIVKPKALYKVCQTKPHIPLLVLAVGGFIAASVWYLAAGDPPPDRSRELNEAGGPNWEKVARQIISEGGVDAFLAKQGTPATGDETLRPETERFFRMGSTRVGSDGGSAPLDLEESWSYTEELTMFLSSPTVQRGRVYVGSCYLDLGTSYGSVVCIDAKTGHEVWMTDTMPGDLPLTGIFSSPAITADGKYVVIGQGLHFDKDSRLVCLEADTGRVYWTIETPLHLEGSPAIAGDLVVIGAGAIEEMPSRKAISHPGYVLAAKISTGETLWKYDLNDPESSPAIADGIVYIGSGFNGNAVVALRSETDDELKAKGLDRLVWRTPTRHPITSAITLIDDRLIASGGNGDYIASDHDSPGGVVVALLQSTGRMLWQAQTDDAILGAPAVKDGKVICAGRTGEVIALALDTGTVLWRTHVSEQVPVLAACAFVNEYIYAVSQNGYLAVLAADSGRLLEKHYINDKKHPGEMGLCISSPTIAGGRLYVGTETGGLRCFTGKGGER